MSDATAAYGVVVVIFGVFLLILAVLWTILPFVVVSMNDKLRNVHRQLVKTNDLLEQIREGVYDSRSRGT